MTLPTISVITPSFNQGKFIGETIESVLGQNYPGLEYIVVDGGSTDQTLQILKSYGKRLRYLSGKDKGQTDAINKGLRLAHGGVLCYLNSDDVLLPSALKRVGEYFAKHPGCDWLTGDCLVIGEKGGPRPGAFLIRAYKRLLLRSYSPTLLTIADNMLPQPSTFWTRRAYETVGEFDSSLQFVMDYDYWLRLAKYYRPHDLALPLAAFRAHLESKSETSRRALMAEGDQVLAKHGAKSWQLILHRGHSALIRTVYNFLRG